MDGVLWRLWTRPGRTSSLPGSMSRPRIDPTTHIARQLTGAATAPTHIPWGQAPPSYHAFSIQKQVGLHYGSYEGCF